MTKSNPLDRAFDLLDIVVSANRDMPLVEIVQTSGLPQSTAFRLASNLVESGMLAFNARNKTYRAGGRVLRLSLFATGQKKMEEVIRPALEEVTRITEETAYFVLRGADDNRLFAYVVPELGARAFVHPGNTFPIHATAAGKVIAAFSQLDSDFLAEVRNLEKFQQRTITDVKILEKLYGEIRAQGYAVNDSELDEDVFSACAPVFFSKEIAGAIGFVGPRNRINPEDSAHVGELIVELTRCGRHLSTLISFQDSVNP